MKFYDILFSIRGVNRNAEAYIMLFCLFKILSLDVVTDCSVTKITSYKYYS